MAWLPPPRMPSKNVRPTHLRRGGNRPISFPAPEPEGGRGPKVDRVRDNIKVKSPYTRTVRSPRCRERAVQTTEPTV